MGKNWLKMVISEVSNAINIRAVGVFIFSDKHAAKPESAAKRDLAVILYSLGKTSYGFIAKLFGVTRAAVLNMTNPKWEAQCSLCTFILGENNFFLFAARSAA